MYYGYYIVQLYYSISFLQVAVYFYQRWFDLFLHGFSGLPLYHTTLLCGRYPPHRQKHPRLPRELANKRPEERIQTINLFPTILRPSICCGKLTDLFLFIRELALIKWQFKCILLSETNSESFQWAMPLWLFSSLMLFVLNASNK